jgi:hypothetical protein
LLVRNLIATVAKSEGQSLVQWLCGMKEAALLAARLESNIIQDKSPPAHDCTRGGCDRSGQKKNYLGLIV